MLTSFSDRDRILDALDAGAIGYLLKDTEPDELLRGVRAAAKGDWPLDPRAALDPGSEKLGRERQIQGMAELLSEVEAELERAMKDLKARIR